MVASVFSSLYTGRCHAGSYRIPHNVFFKFSELLQVAETIFISYCIVLRRRLPRLFTSAFEDFLWFLTCKKIRLGLFSMFLAFKIMENEWPLAKELVIINKTKGSKLMYTI
jgi:hypothetical protein